jgi:hypothetical protein
MPAIFKLVVTRPSLNHKFWFEVNLDIENNYLELPPTAPQMQDYKNSIGTGFITSYYEEMISYQEIASRENDVPIETKGIFFLPRETYPITEDFIWETVADADPKLVPLFGWGYTRQPPFNPFSLTYTFVVEFDTMENLQDAYQRLWNNRRYQDMTNSASAFDNTVKLYIDGVEVVPQ